MQISYTVSYLDDGDVRVQDFQSYVVEYFRSVHLLRGN